MRPASAEIALQLGADISIRNDGIVLEQSLRPHHHAGNAVAALRGLLGDEGALHWAGIIGAAQSLHRSDLSAFQQQDRRNAGKDGLAVYHDGACAALTEAASELGSVEREVVTQHIKERRIGIGRDIGLTAVDGELHCFSLWLASAGAPPVPWLGWRPMGRVPVLASRTSVLAARTSLA